MIKPRKRRIQLGLTGSNLTLIEEAARLSGTTSKVVMRTLFAEIRAALAKNQTKVHMPAYWVEASRHVQAIEFVPGDGQLDE